MLKSGTEYHLLNRPVADSWFEEQYKKKVAVKDLEAATKYRFDPKLGTGRVGSKLGD